MLKRILLTFLLISGLAANAAVNTLNAVIISKVDGVTSVVLRTDEVAKVKKEVQSSSKIVLTLKDVTQSESINALYKNVSDIDGLIIHNERNGDIKIYVEAPEISKANVIFETPNSAPITVINSSNKEMVVWGIILIALLAIVIRSARNLTNEPVQVDINEIIKEREKALYKSFQREVATLPSMNYKLKGYRKHVLKGETIRSYESRMSKV